MIPPMHSCYREQNFDFDLLTPQKLLEKYVGRSVTVIRTNPATGAETREPAEVLATNGGVVLKYADRIESGVPGRIAYGRSRPICATGRPWWCSWRAPPAAAGGGTVLSHRRACPGAPTTWRNSPATSRSSISPAG
jgi:hypothetical protein